MPAVVDVSPSAPATVGARHAAVRVQCQRPYFAGQRGYAETLLLLDGCDRPAAGLIVHDCLEVRALKDTLGEAIRFGDRERVPCRQVAAACWIHIASALDLTGPQYRALTHHAAVALRVDDHIAVGLLEVS